MKMQSSVLHLAGRPARRLVLLLVLPVVLTVTTLTLGQTLPSPPPPVGSAPTRSDRVLVRPLPGADLTPLNLQLGVTVLRTFPGIGGLEVVQIPAGSTVGGVISAYLTSGLVQYAEPDYFVQQLLEPNDFRYWDGSLWAMKNTGQLGGTPGADIKAPQGWDIQHDAPNVIVAVIDTGIRLTHEDLAGNLWTNPSPGPVNDVHGINAITGSGDPTDDNGHGSHVAGTIGAVGNNSVGVVGVAWRVQLMALKFIDAQGNGSISDAITCIDYARTHHANIINASWGGTGFQSTALHDSIAAARDAGILFVAAAGNSQGNNDVTPLYPASYNQQLDNVIAVASTNRNDGLSSYSNYGARTVNLGAPGEGIFSCWNSGDSAYQYDSGTSMAAAHVSGVAAVVLAHNPSASYTAVAQNIFSGTDPLPSLQGRCVTGGRLNLYRALGAVSPPTVPAAPSNLSASATSSNTINLTWTNNATNAQGNTIERSTDNVTFTQIASLAVNTTSYSDTGLAASTTYYYRVRAFNAAGNSGYSNTASATTQAPPPTMPAAPSSLSASATSSSAISLTWTNNATNAQGNTVERSTDNVTFAQIASLAANSTSYSDTGLIASTTYYYRVRAFNAAGNSGYSNTVSAQTQSPPPTVPAAPSSLSASATSSSAINLTWTNNASNAQGNTIERSTDNVTFTQIASLAVNTTSYSDTGLAASTTYYYRVRAFNAAGNSGYSNTASATTQAPPPTMPAAPSSLSASATSSSAISLTWTNNATNAQGNTVERSTDNATFTQIASLAANSTNYSDTGLTASTTYYYRVRAFNAAGNSGYSNTASATTQAPPPTMPAAPSSLSASATSSSAISLTWTNNATNAQGNTVERSTDNVTFAQIASLAANSTSYSDTGLSASTTYYYRVRAFNSAGSSGYSNTASATTPPPPTPATVTVVASVPLANEAGTPGQFTITRSGDTSQALTVVFTAGGTAKPGTDYQSMGTSVVIPAGASSVTVPVVPIDNHVVEVVPLTVTLTLGVNPGYSAGLPGSAVVSILDSDLVALPLL